MRSGPTLDPAIAREKCVDQLLAAFATVGIPIIFLKGAALAHRIYPSPELRPMVDIDVLIDPADTERAVAITRGLGYSFACRHESRFAGRMHHLPAATIDRSGFRIALELHVDAMSPDQADSLTFATLTAEPQPFAAADRAVWPWDTPTCCATLLVMHSNRPGGSA